MLDSLLGTNFKAKCKSEIKSTRARIELVRRRAEAKQRFLKEDLAKLLVNGLDVDAFSRTEEYLTLQNILGSYDFIEQTCDYIKGRLSCMQKQRECPEECREAVGSLMFAAARFSDLPELRDLRDLLKQRYGNSLECFVNQKFLEILSSRPPERERKIKLLKDITSEYSLKWDEKGLEQRRAPPPAIAQFQSQARKHGSNHVAAKDYNQLIKKDESARPDNHEYPTTDKRSELASGGDKMPRSAEGTFYTRENSIRESTNQDVTRQMHGDREGFKREFSTPETDRRDATQQRPELVQAKDQAQTGVEYLRRNKPDIHNKNDRMEGRSETLNNEILLRNGKDAEATDKFRSNHVKGDWRRRPETLNNEILLPNGKEAEAADKSRSNHAKEDSSHKTVRSHRSHDTERSENVDTRFMIQNNRVNKISNGNTEMIPFQGQILMERQDVPSGPNYRSERDVEKFKMNVLEENSVPAPPYSRPNNSLLPPPYTKPSDSKNRSSRGSRLENSEYGGPCVESSHNRDHPVDLSERIQKEADQSKQEKERAVVDLSERIQKEADQSKQEKERVARIRSKNHYLEDLDHDHNGMIPLPKPRSIRRKHRRSSSHQNEAISSEDAGAIRRSSTSRRREHPRKGLQILVDDEKPKDDKEEKIIDKMLLHYCKKSSNYDIEKLRPKSHAPPEQRTVHAGESSHDQRRGVVHGEKSEHTPVPTRSFSLPPKHNAPPQDIKSFTRVNSFQPDDQARHVHPNLPDYDDFVARLAALRG